MPTLTCNRVIFHSAVGEADFFTFAASIKAVKNVELDRYFLRLDVSERPSEACLRDLIALFQNYRLSDISQLAAFLRPSNQAWFADPQTSWHKKIFGNSMRR